jgi:putative membrane-bound dehydrogenase-like protein
MKKALATLTLLVSGSLSLLPAQASTPGWGSARWVWDEADANTVAQTNDPRYLRRTFQLPAKAVQAELWITVDNYYAVYVNGHKVGADGEWQTIEKYDVAKHLVAGKNVLAILAKNDGGPAGAIARLHGKTADGKEFFVGTDDQTRITQVLHADWLKVDFDDSAWPRAVVLGDASLAPWNLTAGGSGQPGSQQGFNFAVADPKVKERQKGEDQVKNFIVPEGFEVELVATDPLIINPVTMAVDDEGRIYVSESHTYRYGPSGSPVKPFANPVVRLDPLPGGKGYQRTLVADGFDDPVMGIAVKGGQLWLTANNFLYHYDLTAQGKAINKKTLVVDKNKAWNPFGMFVLEWGPDALLYMSVGNHNMDLQVPGGYKLTSRGGSGIIVRMNPDGTGMERLVQGLRVPYSFEFDTFGQLWLLSNGEGNPDRFVRVLDGVDYHCFSRPNVDNNWLAGNHPLAPPCFEVHRGAHTQLLRYYGAAFPASYQGSLLACNWGSHGFPGVNRGIFRYIPDERNNIVKKEPFVLCSDPYFRPSHIFLDPDGNLLIADWYGRDDESDLTGRIWRVRYKGKEPRPAVEHKLDSPDWSKEDYAIAALGSPHHLVRAKAVEELVRRGNPAVTKLGKSAATAKEPLGAANALWTLLRIGTPEALAALAAGAAHPDWRVRRLAINLLRRYHVPQAEEVAQRLAKDEDPAVRVEAALALAGSEKIRAALVAALRHGAAKDAHLRYEAAWHLARHADEISLHKLLTDADEDVRLAGLIAIDMACYENFSSKKTALAGLGQALEAPGKLDLNLALDVARLNGDAPLAPALEKLVAREDLPVGVIARALLVFRSLPGNSSKSVAAAAAKRFVEAVEKGDLKVSSNADKLLLFEFLEATGPTPFALNQIAGQVKSNQPPVRAAALLLARKFGSKSAAIAKILWPEVLNVKTKADDAAEYLATLAAVEAAPHKENWHKLLTGNNALLRTEAVRWWRTFKDRPEMIDLLVREAPMLVKQDDRLREDLALVFAHLDVKPETVKLLQLPAPEKDKDALTRFTLDTVAKMLPAERQQRALLGKQVFERSGCTKCHTTATQTTLLAPSLKGIAAQKVDYLVESVLYPSKVIKTGFEVETVTLKDGKVYSGLVKEEDGFLRVLNVDQDVRVPKTAVEERRVQKVSIMPEGQEAGMSRREFVDLIVYLGTLK